MPGRNQSLGTEDPVHQESTLSRLGRGFFNVLRWLLRASMLCLSLLLAPITTILALILMLASWRKGSFESFNAFINEHLYAAIALLILEVGLLHWLFPVTNIAATSLLGFLGGPVVWIIFASSAALLLGVVLGSLIGSSLSASTIALYARRNGLHQPEDLPQEKASLFKWVFLPLVAFIFAPISTVIGLLITFVFKKETSFADLIKANPFVAFAFVALEAGVLHWLLPASNFVFTLTASAIGTVLTPILWVLFSLAAIFILYSLYKSFSAAKVGSATDQALSASHTSTAAVPGPAQRAGYAPPVAPTVPGQQHAGNRASANTKK